MNKHTYNNDRFRLHVVVHTILWHKSDNLILLIERSGTGFMDGRHSLPGGYLQPSETIMQAGSRELSEEVGVEAVNLEPSCVLPYQGGINFIFSCRKWLGEAHNAEPEKCRSVDWFPLDALPASATRWLPKALELAQSTRWFEEFRS